MPLTHRYAENLSALASPVAPQVLSGQRLQLVNHALATSLRLPESWWQQNHITEQLSCPASVLSAGAVAQKYGGHQFGQWNPYLGDGRGLLLGEATSRAQAKRLIHGVQMDAPYYVPQFVNTLAVKPCMRLVLLHPEVCVCSVAMKLSFVNSPNPAQ